METSATTTLEQEVIRFWVDLGSELGFPRSIGEIYGVLFISEAPISADDLVDKLSISRSGAGQGLKILQEIGAIRRASNLSSRKEHYEIQTDLSILVRSFFNIRIFPKMSELNRQRHSLAEKITDHESPHLSQRFTKLDHWCEKSKPALKTLSAFLN